MSEQAKGRLVPRYPLAFGITKWGPLPGTRDMWIMWTGPGSQLELLASGAGRPGGSFVRAITHQTANGHYDTVDDAEKAVNAFVAAGLHAS